MRAFLFRCTFVIALSRAAALAVPKIVELESQDTEASAAMPTVEQHRSLADRYWKKGQCRYKKGDPQWRKKASNSWHDCPANTVCDDGRSGCQCAAGFYPTANSESAYPTCTACAAGTVSNVGDSSCSACPAGTAAVEGTTCKTCHAGTASAEGASSCANCPAGTASDEGAEKCTPYELTAFEFQSHSKCYSNKEQLSGSDGLVATVSAGLEDGVGKGARECEDACRQALAAGTDNEAGCCFLNTFNGACKFFDGALEASSVVTNDEYVRQYFAGPMEKFFGPALSCTGSATEMESASLKTCSGEGLTVATFDLDGSAGKDTSKNAKCYDACVLHAQVEGDRGGCCRMNHFNGNCNWFTGEHTDTSTTHMYHAIDLACS